MKRKASAVWIGGLRNGSGALSTESGALANVSFGFESRFGLRPDGTNPEELIGAAHASSFVMALSLVLAQAGLDAERIEAHADITLELVNGSFEITESQLTVIASVPGMDQAKFQAIAHHAKAGCQVSKAMRAKMSLHAVLGT